jgi:hypothetical protein
MIRKKGVASLIRSSLPILFGLPLHDGSGGFSAARVLGSAQFGPELEGLLDQELPMTVSVQNSRYTDRTVREEDQL